MSASIDCDDIEALSASFCLPEVYEYLADGQEPPSSIAPAWVESAATDLARYGGGLWVLDGTDLDVGGLVRLAGDDHGELELIYLLHPNLWGRGLATQMAHSAMQRAFAAGLVSTIWAGADAPNTASLAVMKRLGMQFRREVHYSLGLGMEYQMKAAAFEPTRIGALPIA